MLELTVVSPPDAIQEVNFETYVSEMLTHLRALNNQFSTTKESDPAYAILQVVAYRISLLVQETNEAVRAVMLATSKGKDLDNLGVIYNQPRKVITPGDLDAVPPVEEVLETDSNYRNRLLEAFKSLALGSREWYKKLVVESGSPFEFIVKDLQVLGPEDSDDSTGTIPPGEVWCYIESISETNPIPTQKTITDVQNYLDSNQLPDGTTPRIRSLDRRFVGDTIRVYSCIQKPYTISVKLKPISGVTLSTAIENVEKSALEFADTYRRIGEKVPLSNIYSAINTEEVLEMDINYPKSNIEPAINELPIVSFAFEMKVRTFTKGITWSNFAADTGPKWSIIVHNTDPHIVFTSDISAEDLRQLQGVGAGRKFEILDKSNDPADVKLSGQIISEFGTATDNSNTHYYFELSENPDLTDIDAGELYVSWESGVEIS